MSIPTQMFWPCRYDQPSQPVKKEKEQDDKERTKTHEARQEQPKQIDNNSGLRDA
jgi:hypothetical protein